MGKNFDNILKNINVKKEMKTYALKLIDKIDKLKWEGSCHATSSIMYVLLSELELNLLF